ncbi:MAG: hypothetical protein AAFZ89_11310 [Bacteroidota bacterium]
MMDELELLKKDWQKKDNRHPKLSYDEIYKMIWKKSSSIVKWIFYISIIEFVFWAVINIVFTDKESLSTMKTIHIYELNMVLTVVNYLVLLFFIYKFYVNYKKISFTDSSRKLMKTILNVKRTVTQYVWFNIMVFTVSFIISVYGVFNYGEDGKKLYDAASNAGNETTFWVMIIGISVVTIAILLALIWLFYKLLYGILLKKLRANYNELKRLEV